MQSSELAKKLGVTYPIVQGPFGGGLSSIELASTVSNAGGLGSYGAHILSPQGIIDLTNAMRERTDKPFAVNLWVSDHDKGGLDLNKENFERYFNYFKPYYDLLGINPPAFPDSITERFEDQVEAILEAAPPVFSFVYGVPPKEVLTECNKRGIRTIGAATTVEEAVLLADAGTDVILATGFEAGGHRVSFLQEPEECLMGGLSLIPQVVDAVSKPVIAAGGVVDARGVKAALALGASGVQVGTAFLACRESGTSDFHRDELFSARARTTVLSRAFTGRLARFIRNRFTDEIAAHPNLPLPFPLHSFFAGHIKRAATDKKNHEFASHYASQSAPLLKHKEANQLMQELIKGL